MDIFRSQIFAISIIFNYQAFDDAIAELDTLNEDSYKDSTLIMQVNSRRYSFLKTLTVALPSFSETTSLCGLRTPLAKARRAGKAAATRELANHLKHL